MSSLHDKPAWDKESADENSKAEKVFSQMLRDDSRSIYFATYQGVAAGSIDLVVVPNLTADLSPWATIENIVVLPEYQLKGIGRCLMEAAIERAREAGCYQVQLVSGTQRIAAHSLYKELGFDADVKGFRKYL